jgi:ribose transport system ATP-binding protein
MAFSPAVPAPVERPSAPLLELRHISKSFGAAFALFDVSLALWPGEVHALAGENGAGKSTLIKILSGVHTDYSGELRVWGAACRFASPRQARAAGIATIHQELSLVPSLSTTDNLLISSPGSALSIVSRTEARAEAHRLIERMALDIDPDAPVEALSLSERQLVEIGRALVRAASVLILDEPTSALSEPETERLFAELERARDAGTSIIYISHRMEEMYRVADHISVLRDGRLVLTRPATELSRAELVAAMVGERLGRERAGVESTGGMPPAATRAPPAIASSADEVLSVHELSCPAPVRVSNVSFSIRRGEIVGLAGLRGSGASTVLSALFGAAGPVRGQIELAGASYVPTTPRAALDRGLLLLAADRSLSVVASLGISANATLSSLERYSRLGFVRRALERREVARHLGELALRAPSLSAEALTLSGGNQQKLALLRCLLAQPRVLLLDDPTRGVDVGAKADLYRLFRKLAADGLALLLHSSELDELRSVCDRVLVLCKGSVVTPLEREELDRARLLQAMMGAAT